MDDLNDFLKSQAAEVQKLVPGSQVVEYATTPKKISSSQAESLKNDICPDCGADLDTGYECNGCGKDWLWAVSEPKKIIISHPDTLKGFAAAFAAWYGLVVACPPDRERPEVSLLPRRFDTCSICPSAELEKCEGVGECVGTCPQVMDLFEICADSRYAASEVWEQRVDGYPVPDVIRYAEDGALTFPASEDIRAYLETVPRSSEGLMDFLNFDRHAAAFAGAAVRRAVRRCAEIALHEPRVWPKLDEPTPDPQHRISKKICEAFGGRLEVSWNETKE